jgi:hypothetical protein
LISKNRQQTTKQQTTKRKSAMNFNGNENCEKWVAGGGTTALGTIGTVLGGAALLGNGNGLGGLLGGGNNELQKENAALQSKVAALEAEKYSDANDAKIYDAVRKLEEEQATTSAELKCLKQELTTYEVSQREIQGLQKQLTDCKIDGVAKDLNCLAGTVDNAVCSFNGKINAINAKIGGFTKTVIPQSAICDLDDCSGCQK